MLRVYSSFSKDKILDNKGKIRSIKKGGPAFFIENVLKKDKFPCYLRTGKIINVEIKLENNKEIGKVKEKINPQKIYFKNKDNAILVSTIGREWIFDNIEDIKTKIFLDIQGYVRNLDFFGKKKFFNNSFLNNIFCIKGTEEEVKYIPKSILEKQKNKCLIITKGGRGSIVYSENKKFIFKPGKIIRAKDTIGVGDTFFASFVLSFIKNKGNIKIAGEKATAQSAKFLSDAK